MFPVHDGVLSVHDAAALSDRFCCCSVRERVDTEVKEKEKVISDLEKAEKLKNQLATEVDEHHTAIEHKNNLSLRSSVVVSSTHRGGGCLRSVPSCV